VASSFLAERADGQGAIPVFYHTAKHFRVPEDPATNMIMVGPGTGIAPFRAMLQERKASGASGKNWLFFGEQQAKSDFFYQDEFEGYQADGTLAKFTTAFSRDQAEKIYVQHRILENAGAFYDWLENGAIFYICGDAARMAKDVDTAIHQVVEKVGGKTTEQAKEYVDALKKEKRYRKDVY
jgi:sulfite reductase (NADPH) flavoprotein alpha-component